MAWSSGIRTAVSPCSCTLVTLYRLACHIHENVQASRMLPAVDHRGEDWQEKIGLHCTLAPLLYITHTLCSLYTNLAIVNSSDNELAA